MRFLRTRLAYLRISWKLKSGQKFALISDVDGVLTDGKFSYTSQGKEMKTFGSHDADAIKQTRLFEKIVFVSADKRGLPITSARLRDMGFEAKLCNPEDRVEVIANHRNQGFCVIYLGDSFTDLAAYEASDFSVAPRDSFYLCTKAADVLLRSRGGEGAVAELIMKIEGMP